MPETKPLRLAIHGAAGRMGRRLVALASEDTTWNVVAALDAPSHPRLGEDAGAIAGTAAMGVPLTSELPQAVDVVIDFSLPEAADRIAALCVERGAPLVVATTGLAGVSLVALKAAAKSIPLVYAPNMSLAVNVAMKLATEAARALKAAPGGVDVEIIERHHRYKEDSPSGTALRFGKLIADALGGLTETHGRLGRPGQRPAGELGYHAVRAGDNPGEHTILFGLLGESVEIRVAATSRDAYATGALAAAKWLVRQPAGMYGMSDVLGLSERES